MRNTTRCWLVVFFGVDEPLREQGSELEINYARGWKRLDDGALEGSYHVTTVSRVSLKCSESSVLPFVTSEVYGECSWLDFSGRIKDIGLRALLCLLVSSV